MAPELHPGMQCAEFQGAVAEAVDGTLPAADLRRLEAHGAACPACATLFAEARAGLNWLRSLPEVEPPPELVKRILVLTTGGQRRAANRWAERFRELVEPRLRPVWTAVLQPRFAMSFAMAFFSITMMLSATGFKLSSLRHVDLRPSAIARTYYETTGRLAKYYDNIRFVYELETRVRDLKRGASPETQTPDQQKPKDNNKGVDRDPGKYQNYSRDEAQRILARHLEGGRELAAFAGRIS